MVVIAIMIGILIVNDINNEEEIGEGEIVETILRDLPYNISAGDRVIEFDTETISYTERGEYNKLDLPRGLRNNETPLNYIEDVIEDRLSLEHIQDSPLHIYDYSVSFYELRERKGISAFVRVMNFPDDSIGGSEERFDFSIQNSDWEIEWYGERFYCRRMDNEFWASPGELCP